MTGEYGMKKSRLLMARLMVPMFSNLEASHRMDLLPRARAPNSILPRHRATISPFRMRSAASPSTSELQTESYLPNSLQAVSALATSFQSDVGSSPRYKFPRGGMNDSLPCSCIRCAYTH